VLVASYPNVTESSRTALSEEEDTVTAAPAEARHGGAAEKEGRL